MDSSEIQSPESASRLSGKESAISTPNSLRSTQPDIALVVRKQPPTHVFSEEWFDVDFGLDFSKAGSLTHAGTSEVEFICTLLHAKDLQPAEGLVVEPRSIWFSMRGTPPRRKQRVRCQIRNDIIRRDVGESYCIRLSPKNQQGPAMSPGDNLPPVTTTPINLVNHKIRVGTDSEWESVWYKDEGGRDKSMTIVASLHNKKGEMYEGQPIPLQLALYYNSEDHLPIKVMRQDIMRTIGGSKPMIDEATGKTTLRFRIEDVSKNHQGQDFKIEVAVAAKGIKDVAPGFSPAVSVRSKRNKRHRSQVSSSRAENLGTPDGRPTIYEESRGSDSVFAPGDLPRLREALKGIIHWTEEVVNGMVALQWQIIGYHQNPDGSPDYSRPYHNIPNPEAVMSRVLGMYSESTRDQLMALLRAVDSGPQDPYSTMIPPPSVPPGVADEEYHPQHHGMPIQSLGGRPAFAPGMHSNVAQEAFRDKHDDRPDMMNYSPPQQEMQGMRPMGGGMYPPMRSRHPMPPPPGGMHHGPMHPPMHPGPMHPTMQMVPPRGPTPPNRESEVAYVLAKRYVSLRTGERLGFPAFTQNKELLGFYRETSVGVGQFIPILRHSQDFGPMEIMQATDILQEAINNKSEAVHALKDWGSISNLLDHALVYDWSKDIGGGQQSDSSTPSD
jgi:hypothetical protein